MIYAKGTNQDQQPQTASSLKYIQDNTENEKINILYNHLPFSIFGSFACSTVAYFSLKQPVSSYIKLWFFSVIIISIFRYCLVFVRKHTPTTPKMHFMLFTIGMALSASCWGVLGSILMPIDDLMQQMIIITIVAGVSAGAMQTLQASLTCCLLFLILAIFPLLVWVFIQQTFEHYALSLAIVIYLFFCSVSAFRGNRLINQVLKLNFKNLDLVCRLYKKNDELTIKNTQLERHEQDMNVINQMNKKLQLCQNSAEAHQAIKESVEKLFKEFNGGLTISDEMRHQNLVTKWGEKDTLHSKFSSDHCWAIQNKSQYTVDTPEGDLFCKHYITPPYGSCCIPLTVDNKLLGIINFNFSNQIILTNYIKQLITAFADSVQLALAKIQLQEKLQIEATHDPLTNLFNRRYLNEALTRELHRVVRENISLCLVMLDLDDFKKFNDTYGHEAGDEILKHISKLLMAHLRGSDLACRFGGEEFVLVFNNTSIDKLMPYLEDLREEIEKAVINFHNEPLRITVSIGVAQAPDHGTNVDDIIRSADTALYSAKRAGRNTIKTTQSVVPVKGAH